MHKKFMLSVLIICLVGSAWTFAADLMFHPNIGITPNPIHTGDNVTFAALVKSSGGISNNVRVIAKMGNTVIFDNVYPALAANTYKTITVNWVATWGTHTVKFKIESVDPTTPDTTTSNNEVSKTFTVDDLITTATAASGKKFGRQSTSVVLPETPCTMHQDDPTDLEVSNFSMSWASATQWKITAQVKNNGQRCLKFFLWKVTNTPHPVTQKYEGSPNNPGWVLEPGEMYFVQKTVDADANPPFWYQGNLKLSRFTFIVDPNNEIPDPNRSNNTATSDLQVP